MKHLPLPSLLMFCFLTAAAPVAQSQPPPPPSDAASAQADDLDHRGVELLKKHQWAEAEDLFRQALALKRSYDIIGNLGLAEAGAGKWRDAAEHLSRAISTFPANGKPAHRDLLREKLTSAREQVAALTIEVNVPYAEVLVDGVSVGTSPLPDAVFVEPGPHRVEARRSGYEDKSEAVQGAKGGAGSVKLTLVEAPPVAAPSNTGTPGWPPSPPPLVPGGPNRAVVITGGVVTGIGLAAGIGLAVAAQGKASTADAGLAMLTAPQSANLCQSSACATINSDRQAHDALAKGALGAFVTAGAIGAATLGYALLSPKSPPKAGTRVVPLVGSTEAGVAIEGAW